MHCLPSAEYTVLECHQMHMPTNLYLHHLKTKIPHPLSCVTAIKTSLMTHGITDNPVQSRMYAVVQ